MAINNLNLSGFSGAIHPQFIHGNSDGVTTFVCFDLVPECYW